MRTTTFLCGTLALIFACRGNDNNNGTDGGGGGGDAGGSGFVTIQQIQDPSMPAGTPVSVQGVIVTAIDSYGTKTGDMWVEEPEGGAFSGVHVYNAPVSQVSSLQPGDVVTITGAEKSEFALSSDTTGRTLTELEPVSGGMMTVTKTGTGSLPAVAQVDALSIGQLYDPTQSSAGGGAAFSSAWGMWEGVLVQVTNVGAFGTPKCVGSSCTDPTDTQFSITGNAEVESEMAAFPTGIALDACLSSVTGVVDYFFDYIVIPRTTADVATSGTGCVFENAAGSNASGALCTDGIDDDGNGFTDCADLGCEVGSGAWLGTTCGTSDTTCGCSANFGTAGVNAVNTNYTASSHAVYLHDVYVTAVAQSEYWIGDSLTAAAKGGVLVFSRPPTGLAIGQQLGTVQGIAAPYPGGGSGASQIEVEDVTAGSASGTGTFVPVTGVPASTLFDLTNGAPYAGSLVTVIPAKMTAVGAHNQATFVDNNNTTFTMDDDAFYDYGGSGSAAPPYTVGGCYSITGVMDLQTTDQVRTINPRQATDVITATGCTGT